MDKLLLIFMKTYYGAWLIMAECPGGYALYFVIFFQIFFGLKPGYALLLRIFFRKNFLSLTPYIKVTDNTLSSRHFGLDKRHTGALGYLKKKLSRKKGVGKRQVHLKLSDFFKFFQDANFVF